MVTRMKLPFGSIAVVGFLLFTTLALAAPPQKRTVNRLSRPNEPVVMIAIKARGKAIEFGKPFPGRNDWPGGLSFKIKNTSAKSVSWVRVALTFRKEKGGVRLSDFVTYGIGRWDEDKFAEAGRL